VLLNVLGVLLQAKDHGQTFDALALDALGHLTNAGEQVLPESLADVIQADENWRHNEQKERCNDAEHRENDDLEQVHFQGD
jgi:hypothetical protein